MNILGIVAVATITTLFLHEAHAYGYAVDVYNQLVSVKSFQCLRNSNYQIAIIRVYTPARGGSVDANAYDNILNSKAANLGLELFVQPNSLSSKSGATQFDETKKYLSNKGITVNRLWLMVSDPMRWSADSNSNQNFINSFINRARQNNILVGIYTNWYDWLLVTGGYSVQTGSSISLWYWHTLGQGVSAETNVDFNDFRSFSGWQAPMVKQFGIVENACGITVNRDIYDTNSLQNNTTSNLADSMVEFGTGASIMDIDVASQTLVNSDNTDSMAPTHLFKKIVEENKTV